MFIRRHVAAVALILAASGCSLSEHGLCEPDGGDQAVLDPALLGDWSLVADGPDRPRDGPQINLDGKVLRIQREADRCPLLIAHGGPLPIVTAGSKRRIRRLRAIHR